MPTSTRDDRTDAELVQATLEGDDDAYGRLVQRHQADLYRHALSMVGEEDAQDLVQRALVRGYRRLGDCRQPASVGGWLFRIVSRICKDHLKSPHQRRSRVRLDDETSPPLADATPGAEADADRARMREDLEEALATLAPEKRQAFLLKHLEEYTYGEMSELLGESVPALKMRVHRARKTLREELTAYREEDALRAEEARRPAEGALLATAV